MLKISIFTYITAAVALYGAGLASYNTFVQRREKAKRLRVLLSFEMGDDYLPRVKVKALNIGVKAVIIKKLGVITADHQEVECFANEPFRLTQEFTLEEGRAISGVRRITEIDHDRTSLIAFCEDTIGKRYFGEAGGYNNGVPIKLHRIQRWWTSTLIYKRWLRYQLTKLTNSGVRR